MKVTTETNVGGFTRITHQEHTQAEEKSGIIAALLRAWHTQAQLKNASQNTATDHSTHDLRGGGGLGH